MNTPTQPETQHPPDLSAYMALFVEQAHLFLETLRDSLERLERDPLDASARREAHRAVHTLKGMAGTMHYQQLAALAAEMERPFINEGPVSPEDLAAVRTGSERYAALLSELEAG